MKKGIVIFVCLLIIGALVLVGTAVYYRKTGLADPNAKQRAAGWEPWEYNAYVVREKVPTDIIWIGDWEGFDFEIPIRFETELSDEVLKIRSGYSKAYVVINDLDGDLEISDEEYELLFKYLLNNSRYNFMYLGTKKLAYVVELGGYDPDHIQDRDLSAGFYRVDDALYLNYGSYIKEDVGILDICGAILLTYSDYLDDE